MPVDTIRTDEFPMSRRVAMVVSQKIARKYRLVGNWKEPLLYLDRTASVETSGTKFRYLVTLTTFGSRQEIRFDVVLNEEGGSCILRNEKTEVVEISYFQFSVLWRSGNPYVVLAEEAPEQLRQQKKATIQVWLSASAAVVLAAGAYLFTPSWEATGIQAIFWISFSLLMGMVANGLDRMREARHVS